MAFQRLWRILAQRFTLVSSYVTRREIVEPVAIGDACTCHLCQRYKARNTIRGTAVLSVGKTCSPTDDMVAPRMEGTNCADYFEAVSAENGET